MMKLKPVSFIFSWKQCDLDSNFLISIMLMKQ